MSGRRTGDVFPMHSHPAGGKSSFHVNGVGGGTIAPMLSHTLLAPWQLIALIPSNQGTRAGTVGLAP